MKSIFNKKLSEEKNAIFFISDKKRNINLFKNKVSREDKEIIIKVFEGAKCKTKESLLKEFATVLDFPSYFGNNWDAFDECMKDLSWIIGKKYILIITDFNEVLKDDSASLHIFIDTLKDTVIEWSQDTEFRTATPFSIVLHCEQNYEEKCIELLKKEHVEFINTVT